jgi:predicted heme/steroid binding protein
MRTFTKEELCQYNGKNGAPAYIAYKGNVYDVSNSFLWQKGKHQVVHFAGADLTENLDHDAPHGADLLERVPMIGTLVEEHQITH